MAIEDTYNLLADLFDTEASTIRNLNAHNEMGPYDAYFKRNMYSLGLSRIYDTTNTVDIMTDLSLYGLVDFSYRPINIVGKLDALLSAGILRRITQADEVIFAVNFVADAFDEFAMYYKSMTETGKILTSDPALGQLRPTKGWQSPHNLHERMFQTFYQAFVGDYLVSDRKLAKVKNFDDFLRHARGYFMDFAGMYPFTRSGITRSIYMDPACSGLIVEVGQYDSSNDGEKVGKLWNSPNFQKFKNTAEHFGFMVDKNSPWRLVADLASMRMQKYMNRYGLSFDTVFDGLYTHTNTLDIDMIKVHLLNAYNTLVATKPSGIELVHPKDSCSTSARMRTRKFVRPAMSFMKLQERYPKSYWYRFYYELRLLEERTELDDSSIAKAGREAERIEKRFDKRRAVAYIEDLVQEHVKAPKV